MAEEKMKAFDVFEKDGDCGSMVVFAPNASKAKYVAYQNHDEQLYSFYDCYFDFMRATLVRRAKDLDDCYRGHSVMDWDNSEDRVDLVRKRGWTCLDETDLDCDMCPAAKYCDRYEEFLEAKE